MNFKRVFGSVWQQQETLKKREYKSYEEYAKHQAAKLATLNLDSYNKKFFDVLVSRLGDLSFVQAGKNVLCLGARTGAECQAFIKLGCFAVGIDLNPGQKNSYVVTGDFHNLQYASKSVDIVFTNALDHVFDLDRVLLEISRVLKPGGSLITEIVFGSKDTLHREPGEFESCWWDHSQAVVDKIQANGFSIEARKNFEYPWNGEQVTFLKNNDV